VFCTNCGAQLPNQSRFCSNCGTAVSSSSGSSPSIGSSPAPTASSDALAGKLASTFYERYSDRHLNDRQRRDRIQTDKTLLCHGRFDELVAQHGSLSAAERAVVTRLAWEKSDEAERLKGGVIQAFLLALRLNKLKLTDEEFGNLTYLVSVNRLKSIVNDVGTIMSQVR